MKALIFEGKVVDIAQNKFPVHHSMQWVECDDDVKHGYLYKDGNFINTEQY